ncbi:O-antigen export system permease protein RfbD [Lachnospiraceae bacterium KM106-2]|nr:O-antigen export system permease protein RfbD [Lachnospiraceae bacterium KM106-2]
MEKLNKSKLFKGFYYAMIIYIVCAVLFFVVGDRQLKYKENIKELLNNEEAVGGVTDKVIFDQKITSDDDIVSGVQLLVATYSRKNDGNFIVSLLDSDSKKELASSKVSVKEFQDNATYKVLFDKDVTGLKDRQVIVRITADTKVETKAATIYLNKTMATEKASKNGKEMDGTLCISLINEKPIFFGQHYFLFALLGGLLIALYGFNVIRKFKAGKDSLVTMFVGTYIKYKFLIKQLVSRDFKTKYKRSVLGFFWSFLNPLFTMAIQYIVFSTIFRANIDNFPVYLLTGSILFTFFTESVGVGLTSIINNSSLITKVYMPKYIYPVSKVLSTAINLLISFAPLLLAVLVTGEKITKAYLLLPFVVICLLVFCLGMSFMLSAFMVFFRDTQFLWGIVSLLWMYATPLFYPESIIPSHFAFVLKVNPMYYFIKFARIVIMDGISPEPIQYVMCMLCSAVSLIIGMIVFKKSQDRFVLYL